MTSPGRNFDRCLSGEDCFNPEPSLRPTQLTHEDSISIPTGYCSYCRKAGIIAEESSYYDSDVLLLPPEEAFNQEEYDNFDINESEGLEEEGDHEDSYDVTAEEEGNESPEEEILVEDNVDDEIKQESIGVVSDEMPTEVIEEYTFTLKDSFLETSPYKAPKKPRKPRKKRVVKENGEIAELKSDGSNGGIVSKAVEEVKTRDSFFENRSNFSAKIPPRPTAIPLLIEEEAVVFTKPSFLRRGFYFVKEALAGAFDIASSAGLLVSTVVAPPLIILGTLIQMPLLILIPTRKSIKTLYRLVFDNTHLTFKCIANGFSPLVDGRAIPAFSFLISSAGIVGTPFLTPPVSVMALALGSGTACGWIAWRALRGAIMAESYEPKHYRWRRNWTDTRGLSSKAIHRLNNDFEKCVAQALESMSFKVKLNGTQEARANGHKGPGDGGVDVFFKDDFNRLTLVSCKRLAHPVGVPQIAGIHGVANNKEKYPQGARAMVVTTIGFTQQAIDFAKGNGIILMDIKSLLKQARKIAS